MPFFELLIIAVGLSMDAFAVAVCKGLSMKKTSLKNMLIVGVYFGVFQAVMPLIGYLIANQFSQYITSFDHWIAFGLLSVIGGKMAVESFKKEPAENGNAENGGAHGEQSGLLAPKKMLPLSIATSIDALAVGVSFAFLSVQIVPAVLTIGAATLILSMAGVKIGGVFGAKFKSKAELFGGVILILMGIKILLEHLGVISF